MNRYLGDEQAARLTETFLEKGRAAVFARDDIFLREGEAGGMIGYVVEGGFRHLRRDSRGTEKIAGYSFAGDFVAAFRAFDGEASAVTIQAVEQSAVRLLTPDEAVNLLGWECWCRVAQAAIADIYGRLLLTHTASPGERYDSLAANVPAIFTAVSLREIASYLRMTPETLSRIRTKQSKTLNTGKQ